MCHVSCLNPRDSSSNGYAVAKLAHMSRAGEGLGHLAVLPCNGLDKFSSATQAIRGGAERTEED